MPTQLDPLGPDTAYAERERRWQNLWREGGVADVPDPAPGQPDTSVQVSCPFTSGAAHMGHVRSYSIADAYARYRRARGDAVLMSIGFDAFGLPAELSAAAANTTPEQWVEESVERMRGQFDALGILFNWSRSFISSDPTIYRWSQWLFLVLWKKGMIVRREGRIDWCPSCRTVLAKSQIEDGGCWRCHTRTTVVRQLQWYLRTDFYNDENYRQLADLTGWSELAVKTQRTLLGRVEGYEIDLYDSHDEPLTVFFEDLTDLVEADCVLVSPQLLDVVARFASHPGIGPCDTSERLHRRGVRRLPVVISDLADGIYGPGVVLAYSERDDELAEIVAPAGVSAGTGSRALAEPGDARHAVRYRISSFPVSRQRAWGAPIPIVHCPACGEVPIPVAELPLLPDSPAGAVMPCKCPACGGEGGRETDTLDCHFDATWQQYPQLVPADDRDRLMFDHPEMERWLPISLYVQGTDIGGFILDERSVAKALRDLGHLEYLPDGEPFVRTLMHGMVKFEGHKMSKHLGNVVDPQNLVRRFGADATRFGILSAAAPARDLTWNDEWVLGAERFLGKVGAFARPRLERLARLPTSLRIDRSTQRRLTLARRCTVGIERVGGFLETLEPHRAASEVKAMFVRIEDFRNRFDPALSPDLDDTAEAAALLAFLQILAPLAPHIAEELWEAAGREPFVATAPWPEEV